MFGCYGDTGVFLFAISFSEKSQKTSHGMCVLQMASNTTKYFSKK